MREISVRLFCQQLRAFEQAAKIFLARVAVFALAGTGENFVADFETFELNDADGLFAALPRLTLTEF
jgi:hypothetical protein